MILDGFCSLDRMASTDDLGKCGWQQRKAYDLLLQPSCIQCVQPTNYFEVGSVPAYPKLSVVRAAVVYIFEQRTTQSQHWVIHVITSIRDGENASVSAEHYAYAANGLWNLGPAKRSRFVFPRKLLINRSCTRELFEVSG